MKKITCIVPARLQSTRFPKKILAKIGGKTLLELVYEAAMQVKQFHQVYFAIDSKEAALVIDSFGGKYCMTPPSCPTGTNRIISFLESSDIQSDIWVNWQADEPFIHSAIIDDLLQGIDQGGDIWTLRKEISKEEAIDPNVVKVVVDKHDKALYFSRSVIPYDREGILPTYYKHIGLYAYSTKALEQIKKWPVSSLAKSESLEQLTFLENGLSIHVYKTLYETLGIDTPQDLLKANLIMA